MCNFSKIFLPNHFTKHIKITLENTANWKKMKILYEHLCDLSKAMLRKKSFNILEDEKRFKYWWSETNNDWFQFQYVKGLKVMIFSVTTRKSYSNVNYFIFWRMSTKVAEETTTLKLQDTGISKEPQTRCAYLEQKLLKWYTRGTFKWSFWQTVGSWVCTSLSEQLLGAEVLVV